MVASSVFEISLVIAFSEASGYQQSDGNHQDVICLWIHHGIDISVKFLLSSTEGGSDDLEDGFG